MSLLNDASLVLIPSGYKEDKVYSIIPSDGSGDLDFVRGGSGTRINSLGQVELMPYNRFTWSQDISNANWNIVTNGGPITKTANAGIAPDGTNTATRINITGGGTYSVVGQTSVPPLGQATISGYFKRYGSTDQIFRFFVNGGSVSPDYIATGTWQRFSFQINHTTGGLDGLMNGISQAASDILVWGMQIEQGSTAKPYFPTTDRLNVPRLTYENGCPSLLLEKQSTNLALYSEQLDNATYWAKTRATVTANSIISPDGTQNADLLTDTTFTNDINYTEQAISVSGQTTTYSIFVKKGTSPYISFGFYDNAAHGYIVDTTTWSVTSTFGSPTSFTKQSIGNGWYRISMTKTASTNFIYVSYGVNPNSNGANYNGTSSLTAYFWGAQIEISAYPTSYIPTTSTSVTRLADSCYKTGISSLIGQTSGTIFIDVQNDVNESACIFSMNAGAGTANHIYLGQNGSNLTLYIRNSFTYSIIASSIANVIGRKKIALAYGNSFARIYMNGSEVFNSTAAIIPNGLDRIEMNVFDVSNDIGNVKYNQAILWKRILTDTELAQLTTI